MLPLRDRIISELQKTEVRNISKLLDFMHNEKGFFYVRSSSHDHWIHGTAQHSWRVYQYMRYMWQHPEDIPGNKEALRNPSKAKHAIDPEEVKELTENEIILASLLHDLGKSISKKDFHGIRSKKGSHKKKSNYDTHEARSKELIEDCLGEAILKYQTSLGAIFYHHHKDKKDSKLEKYKDSTLSKLLVKADSMASGTTWNSTRYKDNRSQGSGKKYNDLKHIRRTAMDRTRQVIGYGMFLDYSHNFHTIRSYGPNSIQWNWQNDCIQQVKNGKGDGLLALNVRDAISAAHRYQVRDGKSVCLVIGMDLSIVDAYERNLRQYNPNEESLLICSNLLCAFYSANENNFKFTYQMRDNIQDLYRKQSKDHGVYLPQITFFRDGDDEGFRMVEPWKCDVLLIPDWHGNAIIDMTK